MVEQHAHKALNYTDHAIVMRRGRVGLDLTGEQARTRIGEVEQAYLTSAGGDASDPPPRPHLAARTTAPADRAPRSAAAARAVGCQTSELRSRLGNGALVVPAAHVEAAAGS